MERNISLEEISDGKRYDIHDLVKVGCNDCKGCSACCKGMGNSIVLDPYDIYQLTTNLNLTFEELLKERIELNIVDGVILPNLKMTKSMDQCSFLNSEGRCSVHAYRPGMCRIFPLGRIYEDNDFKYILQVHECKKENKSKVKVQKWIDTPDYKENKQFILEWHYLIKGLQEMIKQSSDENSIKTINMYILNLFMIQPYKKSESFYTQFRERYEKAKKILSI